MKKLLLILILGVCAFTFASCQTATQVKKETATEDILKNAYFFCCESGEVVTVLPLNANEIVVFFEKEDYKMTRAVSASGARFVGEGLEWWSKGNYIETDGFLRKLDDGGILTRCVSFDQLETFQLPGK